MEFEIDEQGRIRIPSMTLTAEQLDECIRDLAQARSYMAPEVPHDLIAGAPTLAQPAPVMRAGTHESNVVLNLRHAGLGWCTFVLPISKARSLVTLVTRGLNVIEPPGYKH